MSPTSVLIRTLGCWGVLIATSVTLQGCFWGWNGAAVEIVNETNETILVSGSGTISATTDLKSAATIAPGGRDTLTFSPYSFSPQVIVNYHGQEKRFNTQLDFMGFDRIYVKKVQFPIISQ